MNAPQELKERIDKRASEIMLERIRENGFEQVANPRSIAAKIERHTGVIVGYDKSTVFLDGEQIEMF